MFCSSPKKKPIDPLARVCSTPQYCTCRSSQSKYTLENILISIRGSNLLRVTYSGAIRLQKKSRQVRWQVSILHGSRCNELQRNGTQIRFEGLFYSREERDQINYMLTFYRIEKYIKSYCRDFPAEIKRTLIGFLLFLFHSSREGVLSADSAGEGRNLTNQITGYFVLLLGKNRLQVYFYFREEIVDLHCYREETDE